MRLMLGQMTAYSKTSLHFFFLLTHVFTPPNRYLEMTLCSYTWFDVYLDTKNMKRCGCSFHVYSPCVTEMEPL